MRRLVAEAGLAPVEFEFGTFFTVIFRRLKRKDSQMGIIDDTRMKFSKKLFSDAVNDAVNDTVKDRLINEFLYIHQSGFITLATMMRLFNISRATAQRDLAHLKNSDVVKFEGAPKTGKYVLTEKGKKVVEEVMK